MIAGDSTRGAERPLVSFARRPTSAWAHRPFAPLAVFAGHLIQHNGVPGPITIFSGAVIPTRPRPQPHFLDGVDIEREFGLCGHLQHLHDPSSTAPVAPTCKRTLETLIALPTRQTNPRQVFFNRNPRFFGRILTKVTVSFGGKTLSIPSSTTSAATLTRTRDGEHRLDGIGALT